MVFLFIFFPQYSYTEDSGSHQAELRPIFHPLHPQELLVKNLLVKNLLVNTYNSLIFEQCSVSAMFSVALHESVTW